MNFVINNGTYELVIPSSTPFNIHLERSEGGYLALFRRTSGEKWDLVKSLSSGALVIDIDVANNIEREYLVRSEGRPTMCVITTAEGSEEVEIPDGGGSNIPDGYVIFKAQDADFISSDGKYIYVKM